MARPIRLAGEPGSLGSLYLLNLRKNVGPVRRGLAEGGDRIAGIFRVLVLAVLVALVLVLVLVWIRESETKRNS